MMGAGTRDSNPYEKIPVTSTLLLCIRAKRKTDNQRLLESNDLLRGALRISVSTLRVLERGEAVQADLAPVIAALTHERQDALVLVEAVRLKRARTAAR